MISTHAPLTGCDSRQAGDHQRLYHFNPRTPHGVRHLFGGFLANLIQFQPTHPSRGATKNRLTGEFKVLISTHAPLTGCDSDYKAGNTIRSNFNPRTPHGVRLRRKRRQRQKGRFQPTHPSRGATRKHCKKRTLPPFQPTHPSRGATTMSALSANPRLFQPTHPSRGATGPSFTAKIRFSISTHAPLTGCDQAQGQGPGSRCHFNPRTPHGVRPGTVTLQVGFRLFQPTHPSRGATTSPSDPLPDSDISTHAPLTGCDCGPDNPPLYVCNFNPRTPHGVRHREIINISRTANFNPRTPHGVRQKSVGRGVFQSDFNPHTPHGVRRMNFVTVFCLLIFQSTHPSRGATDGSQRNNLFGSISIHTPLTGCD